MAIVSGTETTHMAAWPIGGLSGRRDCGYLRLNSNENARGPGAKVLEALHDAISPRLGRGIPPDFTEDLTDTIAAVHHVRRDQVLVATGSGLLIEAAMRAFCAFDKPLVTGAPTFGLPEAIASALGVPIARVGVGASMQLNLAAMTERASGAGLVYVCNPNNPTGAMHRRAAVEAVVRRVTDRTPAARIIVDEAYLDYADDAELASAIPLVHEAPGLVVTRSFSKAHGMAGLRLGYAIGERAALDAISRAWCLGSVNMLSAAAGIASLGDAEHLTNERAENARVRDFTIAAFRAMGYEVADSHTNFIFVNVRRSVRQFRRACAVRKVWVGRDFPPCENSHCRITLGTMDEMRDAVERFRDVLTRPPQGASRQEVEG